MATVLPPFPQLVAPLPPDTFVSAFDGRAAALLRPEVPAPLDLAALDTLVAEGGLRWPTVHLEDATGPVHPGGYTQGVEWGPGFEPHLVTVAGLRDGLARGCRVVLAELQRQHGPTAALVRAYERALHRRGSATAVLSPATAGPRAIPAAAEHRFSAQAHGARCVVVTGPDGGSEVFDVEAGATLYVPPGFAALEEGVGASLVVDVTLRPILVRDVAAAELARLPKDKLRAALPIGGDPAALRERWAELVEGLLDDVDHGAVVEGLVDRFVQSRLPMLRGQLGATIDPPTATMRVRRRPGVVYRVVPAGEVVELRFHGKRVPFPAGAEEFLHALAESPGWTFGELAGLSPSDRIAIARRLVMEGFCEVIAP